MFIFTGKSLRTAIGLRADKVAILCLVDMGCQELGKKTEANSCRTETVASCCGAKASCERIAVIAKVNSCRKVKPSSYTHVHTHTHTHAKQQNLIDETINK